jgi:hypothetical protein
MREDADGRPASARRRSSRVIRRRRAIWPPLAVAGLLLFTATILLFNQRHSGDPLKVRREMRKF